MAYKWDRSNTRLVKICADEAVKRSVGSTCISVPELKLRRSDQSLKPVSGHRLIADGHRLKSCPARLVKLSPESVSADLRGFLERLVPNVRVAGFVTLLRQGSQLQSRWSQGRVRCREAGIARVRHEGPENRRAAICLVPLRNGAAGCVRWWLTRQRRPAVKNLL